MNERPWYQEFFGQRYLDSYSPILTPERTLRQVDFIERVLGLPSDSKILDLCCGHGRHLVELASRGYQMTGLDLDPCFWKWPTVLHKGETCKCAWNTGTCGTSPIPVSLTQ